MELSQGVIPFLFITGDEGFYDTLTSDIAYKNISISNFESGKIMNSRDLFKSVMKKFNVFLIKKEYSDPDDEKEIYQQWVDAIGKERILNIKNPKSCVDIILGAISITSKVRDLEGYMQDLRDRDQNEERMNEVALALKLYDQYVKGKLTRIVHNKLNEIKEEAMRIIQGGEDKERVKYYNGLISIRRTYGKEVPAKFICPIMREIFLDPVHTSDGRIYEKIAFEVWIKNNKTSPLDDLVELKDTSYKVDTVLRKSIREFVDNPRDYIKSLRPPEKKKDSNCLIF
jgi:hypothetical protein